MKATKNAVKHKLLDAMDRYLKTMRKDYPGIIDFVKHRLMKLGKRKQITKHMLVAQLVGLSKATDEWARWMYPRASKVSKTKEYKWFYLGLQTAMSIFNMSPIEDIFKHDVQYKQPKYYKLLQKMIGYMAMRQWDVLRVYEKRQWPKDKKKPPKLTFKYAIGRECPDKKMRKSK